MIAQVGKRHVLFWGRTDDEQSRNISGRISGKECIPANGDSENGAGSGVAVCSIFLHRFQYGRVPAGMVCAN